MPTVSGAVTDINENGVPRTIRVYRRDTGALLGEVQTNASTGAYSLTDAYTGEVQVVMLDDAAGSVENDQILRTTPV
jgi:hypothetical protein